MKETKKPIFPHPCMVCGKPAEMCCPLTFCYHCKDSPKADEIRKHHSEWVRKVRGNC